MMLPSFVDAHAHADFAGRLLFAVQLNGVYQTRPVPGQDRRLRGRSSRVADGAGPGWSNTVAPGIGPLATDLDGRRH